MFWEENLEDKQKNTIFTRVTNSQFLIQSWKGKERFFLIGISNNLVIRNTVPGIMLLKLLAKIKFLIAEVKDGGYIEEFHS